MLSPAVFRKRMSKSLEVITESHLDALLQYEKGILVAGPLTTSHVQPAPAFSRRIGASAHDVVNEPPPWEDLHRANADPVPERLTYPVEAEALYDYDADPKVTDELSFKSGEMLEILDRSNEWWQARKNDGTVGCAPSNFLRLSSRDQPVLFQAEAVFDYDANPEHPDELSFMKGEILVIVETEWEWYKAKKNDGMIGREFS
ncbi:hypothetical protein FPV67DRAFT_1670529 [Lyophyllum atratum]|nr:hypothetical protein FPV67DRAFT_1670529 [Lyophyllum atratum]